jgi:lysozyme family protein
MAASSYDEALSRLLAHEGGYSDHPSDPGGPTNFGITLGDYRAYVKPNATAADVRAMTVDTAKAIYRDKYWNALRGDDLPAGVDYCVFDYGVNSGTARAAKVLQTCLGVPQDGKIGAQTIAAAKRADAAKLIGDICDQRLAFLQGLKTWPVFGNGWGRRVREVRAAALAMAAKAPAQTATPSPGKGVVPKLGAGPAGIAAAVAAAGAALAAQMRAPEIIVAMLAVTLAAALGVFFIWRWRQSGKQQRRNSASGCRPRIPSTPTPTLPLAGGRSTPTRGTIARRANNSVQQQETHMDDLIIFLGFAAAGYALSVYTWPAVRTFFAGAEQEIAWLKERAAALEDQVRGAFGDRG